MADFGDRLLAGLIDYGIPIGIYFVGFFLAGVFGAMDIGALAGLMFLASLVASLGFLVWNLVQQGNTGQTIGKRQMGLRLVKMSDGQLVGVGLSIGRYLLHVVDGAICYIGYLWPLWDPMRQTLADKIVGTVVVKQR